MREAKQLVLHAYTCESGCSHTTYTERYWKKRPHCSSCGVRSEMRYKGAFRVNMAPKRRYGGEPPRPERLSAEQLRELERTLSYHFEEAGPYIRAGKELLAAYTALQKEHARVQEELEMLGEAGIE